jgi:hypothetical protein
MGLHDEVAFDPRQLLDARLRFAANADSRFPIDLDGKFEHVRRVEVKGAAGERRVACNAVRHLDIELEHLGHDTLLLWKGQVSIMLRNFTA